MSMLLPTGRQSKPEEVPGPANQLDATRSIGEHGGTVHMSSTRLAPGLFATSLCALVLAALQAEAGGGLQAALTLEPVLSGLSSPVFVTHAADGSGRLFVLEQPGLIKVLQP